MDGMDPLGAGPMWYPGSMEHPRTVSSSLWGRVLSSFDLSVTVARPPFEVWDHLAEPRNYLGLQVLLTSMSPVTEALSPGGTPLRRYRTVETFRWLGLPLYRNAIDVELELTDPGRALVSRVKSRPRLELTARYRFEAVAEGTRLDLTVGIEVAGWLSKTVTREALRVQTLVLARLKARLEGS